MYPNYDAPQDDSQRARDEDLTDWPANDEPQQELFIPPMRTVKGYREVTRRRVTYFLLALLACLDFTVIILVMVKSFDQQQFIVVGSMLATIKALTLIALRWVYKR